MPYGHIQTKRRRVGIQPHNAADRANGCGLRRGCRGGGRSKRFPVLTRPQKPKPFAWQRVFLRADTAAAGTPFYALFFYLKQLFIIDK